MKRAFIVTAAASHWVGGAGWVTEDSSTPSALQMFAENEIWVVSFACASVKLRFKITACYSRRTPT